MTHMKGKFFVFEGPMGAGKTTQVELLAGHLKSKGKEVILTAEPTKNNRATDEEANCYGLFIRKMIENRLDEHDELNMAHSLMNLSDRMFDDNAGKTDKFVHVFRRMAEKLRWGDKLTELETQLIFLLDREMHLGFIRKKLDEGCWVICDRYELSTYVHYQSETGSKTDILKVWQYPLFGDVYLKPDYCFLFHASPKTLWQRQKESKKTMDKYERVYAQVKRKAVLYEKAGRDFRSMPISDPRHKYPILRINAEPQPGRVFRSVLGYI